VVKIFFLFLLSYFRIPHSLSNKFWSTSLDFRVGSVDRQFGISRPSGGLTRHRSVIPRPIQPSIRKSTVRNYCGTQDALKIEFAALYRSCYT